MKNHHQPIFQHHLTRSLLFALFILAAIAILIFGARVKEEGLLSCQSLSAQFRERAFAEIPLMLGADAWYVYDFSNNMPLLAHNEDLPLPLASLTKLMTARIALEKNEAGIITIDDTDILPNIYTDFATGESYTVRSLVRSALVASSNNAALALSKKSGISENDFIAEMNTEAQKLSLPTLSFKSATGLDEDDIIPTARGSARDILMLLHNDFKDYPIAFMDSRNPELDIHALSGKNIMLKNTNSAIQDLKFLVASKTGYTNSAGGNLAILWKAPDAILVGAVVLGSTQEGRFNDMRLIHSRVNTYLSNVKFISPVCTQ